MSTTSRRDLEVQDDESDMDIIQPIMSVTRAQQDNLKDVILPNRAPQAGYRPTQPVPTLKEAIQSFKLRVETKKLEIAKQEQEARKVEQEKHKLREELEAIK